MLARPRTLPTGFIAPCLPTKAHTLPSGGVWLHEIKHDGFRIIARKDGERVRLYSRPGNDLTRRFPLIVETLARLRSRSCIIDGEAVACDDNGVASFDLIRHHRHNDRAFLYVFDLIELNGDDLRRDPLEVRKATLRSMLAKAGHGLRFNEHMEGDGPTVFAHACKMGLEGIVLDCLADMLSPKNFSGRFEFFIASFSRDGDELGQWRAYADNGRGYAIGFAPHVFRIEEYRSDLRSDEITFVGPVLYDNGEVMERHALAIDKAVAIFLKAVNTNADVVKDETIRDDFIQEFCRNIISWPLIWNCLTSKHRAYKHEKEVRLLMLNQRSNLMPYIKTRLRGSEIVPYIPHRLPIREPNIIAEVVVGPAAGPDAERTVRTMLDSFGIDPKTPMGQSKIPYRVL